MPNNISRLFIILIITIQFLFIIGSVMSYESQLKSAKEIVVKLAPLDPRSLIQGDYVRLRYEFAQECSRKINITSLKKFRVVLTPQQSQFVFKELLTMSEDHLLTEGDIILNGKRGKGNRIIFGIENFFIEEGTGRDIEQRSKYAILKVTKKGNAFVTKLLEDIPK